MLQVSWFEFIVRGIPESFLFVFAVHVFSKTALDLKKYLFSSVAYWLIIYIIRLLPIQYGVHTILGLIVLIVLVTSVNKIDIIKSIRAAILMFIVDFVLEGINISFIQFVLKKDLNSIVNNPILKTLTGMPSLIVFGIFTIAYYFRLLKRKELRYI